MKKKKHTTKVDWGEGLVKYTCGCRQVIGENICPIHQKGIIDEIKDGARKIEGVISMQKEWLLKEATAIAENHPSKDARAFAFAVANFLRKGCECNKSDAINQLEEEC